MKTSPSRLASQKRSAILIGILLTFLSPHYCLGFQFNTTTNTFPDFIHEKCGRCHNASTQKGELDLSNLEGLRRGGESGEPLIAPALEDSRLWQVVSHHEMPPEGEPELSEQEVDKLKEWIVANNSIMTSSDGKSPPESIHDVLPILLLRCASCHGAQRTDGDFDVRSHQSILEGGQSGPAVITNSPDESLMIQRIESEQCPPTELLLKFFVRRPTETETDRLRDWIASGAPRGDIKEDIATQQPDSLVTDADREHWAFVAPKRPTSGDSVDALIHLSQKQAGVTFAPEADRDTLIRRVHFDLTGLPPTLDQWKRWRTEPSDKWYESMIDHLLASPHYGERWGRYWLDLAGYADSEGGISADPIRPVAWKYRDYVIRSFNQDKPYDVFLLEQIAGDELTDHANVDQLNEKQIDQLIATGFLRMGIDETGSRTMNFVPERLKVIDDAIKIVSSGLMGLTMECARCHSHKYDPIPQRDYYRLKAVFQGALDEHNWKSFKQRKLNYGTSEQRDSISLHNPSLEKKRRELQNEIKQQKDQLVTETLSVAFPDQTEHDRLATLAALRIADNQRTLPQRQLVEKLQQAEISATTRTTPSVQQIEQRIEYLQDRIEDVQRSMAPPLTIRALWDQGEASPTYILRRGEHNLAGRLVGPGVPSALTDGKTPFVYDNPFPSGSPKTGRRLAFAQWLTSKQHPTTARVIVNRIWHHHFGRGLVNTLENFGRMGAKPSHPDLLDWLAVEFMEQGWSIKALHRTIMNSRTYKQSSVVSEPALRDDPDNRYYTRMPLRRLDAESLRDSLLLISGRLDLSPGGIPDPVRVSHEGEVSIKPNSNGQWRRSVYAQYRRTEIPSMLDTFDYPQMGPNCFERSVSVVSPQALLLLNNRQVHELAQSFAREIETAASPADSPQKQNTKTTSNRDHQWSQLIDLAYQKSLCRWPTDQEKQLGVKTLEALTAEWNGDASKALESYCHVLMNSASFLYID